MSLTSFLIFLLSMIASGFVTAITSKKIFGLFHLEERALNISMQIVMFVMAFVISVSSMLLLLLIDYWLLFGLLDYEGDYGFLFIPVGLFTFLLNLIVSLIVLWRQSLD